ncbi:hypothetical protein CQW23_23397 [Capsicum baccatum]|uniref:Receptor-like protein 12 n=1 Tax=Capsicum baccatum TaxID=33114 RepID=A0A2G2VRT7_CAPBA|nr:hypothetical protein CQW23_23397 [Capsicum baccatum]
MWLGALPKLKVLSLRVNKFHGSIQPSTIETIFPELQIIDLSQNAFSGNLPASLFQHLKGMRTIDPSKEAPRYRGDTYYKDSITVTTKGLDASLKDLNLTLLRAIHTKDDGLRGFPVSKSCGDDQVSDTNDTISGPDDEESDSEFWSDFWKAALMGYGSGLCIGLSILYFMLSTGNPKWLVRIIEDLEHNIMMRRRKKQREQRNNRRRNNHF